MRSVSRHTETSREAVPRELGTAILLARSGKTAVEKKRRDDNSLITSSLERVGEEVGGGSRLILADDVTVCVRVAGSNVFQGAGARVLGSPRQFISAGNEYIRFARDKRQILRNGKYYERVRERCCSASTVISL